MRSDLGLTDELQKELVRRVMALEGRRETLRLADSQLNTTVEALDECTGVSREDIENIARDLINAARTPVPRPAPVVPDTRSSVPDHQYRIVMVGAAALVLLAVVMLLRQLLAPALSSSAGPDSALQQSSGVVSSQPNHSNYIKRARFAQALGDVSIFRAEVANKYMMDGEFPHSFEQLGYEQQELHSDSVKSLSIGPGGVLMIDLPDHFGDKRYIRLSPHEAMGGANLEWRCTSNVAKKILIGTQCTAG